MALSWASVARPALPEYDLKAALLVKLAKFVTWPAARAGATFRLCVLGTDPFGTSLDSLRSERVGGRAVSVTLLLASERVATSCDLVFLSPLDAAPAREQLQRFGSSGVLTVADLPGFARNGGMIGMVTRDRKIAFEVNLAALRRAGLEVNSQFLQLASVIGGEEETKP